METMKEIYDELIKDERLKGKIFYEHQYKISAIREDGEELWSGFEFDENGEKCLSWDITKDGVVLDGMRFMVKAEDALSTCLNNYLVFLGIE